MRSVWVVILAFSSISLSVGCGEATEEVPVCEGTRPTCSEECTPGCITPGALCGFVQVDTRDEPLLIGCERGDGSEATCNEDAVDGTADDGALVCRGVGAPACLCPSEL